MILKTKLCHCHCDRPKLPWGCSGGLDFLCVQAKGRTNEDVHEVLADLKRIHANIEGCYLLFVNAGRNRRRKWGFWLKRSEFWESRCEIQTFYPSPLNIRRVIWGGRLKRWSMMKWLIMHDLGDIWDLSPFTLQLKESGLRWRIEMMEKTTREEIARDTIRSLIN